MAGEVVERRYGARLAQKRSISSSFVTVVAPPNLPRAPPPPLGGCSSAVPIQTVCVGFFLPSRFRFSKTETRMFLKRPLRCVAPALVFVQRPPSLSNVDFCSLM